MPVLYFIRHGETDWNRQGRLQGQTDIPLNDRGKAQAAALAEVMLAPAHCALSRDQLSSLRFVASPMLRTRETMEILRHALGLAPGAYQQDDRLKEIGFGRWESHTWPQIRARDPAGAKARDADKWGYVPPGGENYAMVMARVAGWLSGISGDCCLVAHGGIARVLLVLLTGMAKDAAVMADIRQGKVLVFEHGRAYWRPDQGGG